MESVQKEIQDDWENREFIEIVSEGIKKIAEFLNDFGECLLGDNRCSKDNESIDAVRCGFPNC